MIDFALFIIKLLKKPIEWWGVDYNQFRTIIKAKLTLDFRRRGESMNGTGKQKKGFIGQLIGFTIMGLFLSFSFFKIDDLMVNLTIYFSMLMVMMGTTLLTEFTTVLFDERDNHILLPRPISARTLLTSRLFHVQFYTGYIALAFALVPSIVLIVKGQGSIILFFLIAVEFCSWITLLFTVLMYLILSKLVNLERLKDIITYFQIVMAIVLFGGYQLLPRIVDMDNLKLFTMSIEWYTYLFPPAWLAGLVTAFTTGFTVQILGLALMGFIVPLVGGFVVMRLFSKGFDWILSGGLVAKKEQPSTIKKGGFSLASLFCVSTIELAGWKLAKSMTSRDRKFKQSVYPSLGFIIVFAFVMLKPDFSNLSESLTNMDDPSKYVFFVMATFFASTVFYQLPFTDTPEVAYLYNVVPLKQPGHILSGAVKSMFARFFLPILALLSVPFLIVIGVKIIPIVILSLSLVIFQTLLSIIFMKMDLPFTQPREMQQKGKYVIRMMLSMVVLGLLLGLVYLASLTPWWAIIGFSIVAIACIHLTYRFIRRRNFVMVG